jgi:hypothetical protein
VDSLDPADLVDRYRKADTRRAEDLTADD